MKPVYKCEYCAFTGVEDEVLAHEVRCTNNYDRRSCYTCEHRGTGDSQFQCDCGKAIPANHIYEFCSDYKRKNEEHLTNVLDILFSAVR